MAKKTGAHGRSEEQRQASEILFAQATSRHQAGSLEEAGRLYLETLAIDPHHAPSLHGLGFIALQKQDYDAAERSMREAVAAGPNDARYRFGLGNALRGQAKREEALASYREALALDPDFADAHNNIAGILQSAGDLKQAAAHYERAVALRPDYAAAHFNLGVVRQALDDLAGAMACFERALALRPQMAEAYNSLGIVLRKLDRLEEAKAHYERALALKPDYADGYSNLGVLLRHMGKLDASAERLTKALSLRPNSASILDNLGNTLRDMGRLAESAACHERAIAIDPSAATAHNNLGYTYRKQGRLKESRASFARGLAVDPRSADIRWNLALLDLLEGDFAEGWRGYEVRYERKQSRPRSFPKPIWRGEPLNGARILLHSEQGLGDSIQFCRYVPMVQAAGGKVILDVPSSLRRLVAHLPGVDTLTVDGEALPEFEWQCPLMSLPLAFQTTFDSIPGEAPYLTVPDDARTAAHQVEWPSGELCVGLVWGGDTKNTEDLTRSMPLSAFEPLLDVEGVQFFSLQVGAAAEQLGAGRGVRPRRIFDLRPAIEDFADTAALIDRLDLVITVDTSVAHLAGALAKPTWLLLAAAPEWRWLLEREDSPWYPTLRLFRQARFGDWPEVVERVRLALVSWVDDRAAD